MNPFAFGLKSAFNESRLLLPRKRLHHDDPLGVSVGELSKVTGCFLSVRCCSTETLVAGALPAQQAEG